MSFERKYPHIFSPIKIGNTVFKNRIWSAPAGTHLLQAQERYPNDATMAYYREKARGGSAAITVSAQNMDLIMLEDPDPIHSAQSVLPVEYRRYWRMLTEQIQFFGAKASLELLAFSYHGYDDDGKLVSWSVNGEAVSEEAVEDTQSEREIDRVAESYSEDAGEYMPMMPVREIERIADTYADAAEAALDCGFDMILLHFGHGLILSEFLSPFFNKRTDEYGGSFENRTRFAVKIIDKIRERVGRKLLIEVRISGDELAGPEGWQVNDTIEFIKMVQDRIDIAHVSAGSQLNETEHIVHPTGYLPPANNAYLAKAVKACPDIKIPVLTLGAFQDPELIEKTLAEGGADMVAMARGTISDPEVPKKALESRPEDIIPCIKCFHCLDYYVGAKTFACTVNPKIGREKLLPGLILPVGEKKNVVVIGGGPAGMAAAIYAKERNHDVVLYERDAWLGGKLVFSQYTSFKYDLCKFMNYQIGRVKKLGVDIRLGVAATPEMVAAENADVVIAALGADAIVPPIPGAKGENVITAEQCYNSLDKLGDSVVIIGGGEVGCESALYLLQNGKKIAIVEMQSELAPDAFWMTHDILTERLTEGGDVYVNARCTGIAEEGITIVDGEGKEQSIKADTVIIAAGMRPRADMAESFRCTAPIFWNVGDSLIARNVRTCTRTAFDAAVQI